VSENTDMTFKELEKAGWTNRADFYDDWFAQITNQSIEPFLEALTGDYRDKTFLDICTGTGHLASAASERGARAEGLDFAETMVTQAKANYPNIVFRQGDAEALPCTDHAYDIVACSFGLLHFEVPERAVAEAFRVLRSGGRYGFTVWRGPDEGGEMFKLVFDSVETHGSMEIDLPAAPPMFRFADPDEVIRVLENAGFTEIEISVIPLSWQPDSGEDVLTLIYKSVVRAPMILERQTDEARELIHRSIVDEAEKSRRDGVIELAFPAVMVTATKP
jgi:SAM-dependent methyltransferase